VVDEDAPRDEALEIPADVASVDPGRVRDEARGEVV
jgi:hypothetical protein